MLRGYGNFITWFQVLTFDWKSHMDMHWCSWTHSLGVSRAISWRNETKTNIDDADGVNVHPERAWVLLLFVLLQPKGCLLLGFKPSTFTIEKSFRIREPTCYFENELIFNIFFKHYISNILNLVRWPRIPATQNLYINSTLLITRFVFFNSKALFLFIKVKTFEAEYKSKWLKLLSLDLNTE